MAARRDHGVVGQQQVDLRAVALDPRRAVGERRRRLDLARIRSARRSARTPRRRSRLVSMLTCWSMVSARRAARRARARRDRTRAARPPRAFSAIRSGLRRRGDGDGHARVAQDPLEQRLRPRLDAELAQRRELVERRAARRSSAPSPSGRITTTPMPSSSASGRISRSTVALARVVRHLDGVEPPRAHHLGELAERRRLVVRRARAADELRRRAATRSGSAARASATRLCTW